MEKKEKIDRVKELTDQLEKGVGELFESDKYKNWLNTMSKFHNYSLNNTLLIAMQMPEATYVAGYMAWQTKFQRHVLKGEKAIKILAPVPYTITAVREKADPDGNFPVHDKNGDPEIEETEVKRIAFKVANVFDISQTQGKELPTLTEHLKGDVSGYETFIEALGNICPVPITFEDIQGGANGYYHLVEDRIAINEGMSEIQTVKTMIHEMAHQRLHSIKENDEPKPESNAKEKTRSDREVEAESVAFVVCQRFGIDTSDYSFSYIGSWSSSREAPELKRSLQLIRETSCKMIDELENELSHLKEKQTEYERHDSGTEAACVEAMIG